jgi:hypothetical protein
LEATLANGAEIRIYEPVNGLTAFRQSRSQASSQSSSTQNIVTNTCKANVDCILVTDHCSCQERCVARSYVSKLVDCDRDCNNQIARQDGAINSCSCMNGVCTTQQRPLTNPENNTMWYLE